MFTNFIMNKVVLWKKKTVGIHFIFYRGSDHPKQLELRPQKITAIKFDGSINEYPLVVSIEPDSYTSLQKHVNEGKIFIVN